MERGRWSHVEELFHEALALDHAERAAFLERACGDDEAMRREIESLLAHEQHAEGFLEASTPTVAARPMAVAESPAESEGWSPPVRIAHYRVLGKLGEGGMGIVYVAADEKLGRRVALKLLRKDSSDPRAAERLVREARVAAGITHPLICQVFELGEWNDQPFIAMELVEGEPLAARLGKGALPPAEALHIAISIAEALAVLHRHGIVHRDLKPSNVFLTPAGAKVLDFGLARPLTSIGLETIQTVTQEGMIVGTPQYAAPEQLSGMVVDARADLFSAGVILFEMLTGRRPFTGSTLPAIVHAVLYETPPVLTGSPAIAAVDRVLYRALAKKPDDRYPTAEALAADLRSVVAVVDDDRVTEARAILRLAVLPFRWLKPDPENDYLSLSLADALTSSLSGLESLVVRSSLKSARYTASIPDLNQLAAELAIDLVLTGSFLRHGDRLRVNAELTSVPAGDVLWHQASDVAIDAVFDFHDQLAQRVVTSLPLTGRDLDRSSSAKPASAKAFDLYLRGMQLRMETSSWRQARSYFEQCLALDPAFAPAWAERGRLDRVIGKYEDPALLVRAESALLKAQTLDPDNGAAVHYFAQLEIDLGRLDVALTRLLGRAQQRRAEPQVYAALVQACRYAGLLEASVAAHDRAHQLDPTISTSVLHTFYVQGDYTRALAEGHRTSDPLEARVLGAMGRDEDAIAAGRREEERFAAVSRIRNFATGVRAALEGKEDEALAALRMFDVSTFTDGEGLFYVAGIYARLAHVDEAFDLLRRAVIAGFACLPAFEKDPYLAPLRALAGWEELIAKVKARQQIAFDAYSRAGGRGILL
jgi:non-specific serine/threonine protein kinase